MTATEADTIKLYLSSWQITTGEFMERNEARETIRRNWRQLITLITDRAQLPMNGEDSYICPLCGHGKGGDGLTYDPKSKDGNSLKCFGCGFSGDIIDLYGQHNGVDFNTALKVLAAESGITIEQPRESAQNDFSQTGAKETTPQNKTAQKPALKRGKEYYSACAAALAESPEAITYLKGRGISLETAQAFNIGYDPAWRSPKATDAGKYVPSSRRIIMPVSQASYIARAIDPPRNDEEKKYQKQNEGAAALFNEAALYDGTDKPVFVLEGLIDALSVIEVGGSAIALNSASNTGLLIAALEAKPTAKTLILSLDNDSTGRKATKQLRDAFKLRNISFITADICGGCKDANEALQKNRAELMAAVDVAQTKTSARPDNVLAYIDNCMAAEIADFKAAGNIKTGFFDLDEQLGGLFPGLIAIAAISSLGKTTLAHQIADNLAASGREVVYFSLEQSALELVTKSLARLTAKRDLYSAKTALSIRCGNFPQSVNNALEEYRKTIGERLSIVEGNFNCNVGYIGDYLREYIHKTGCKPIAFVDYLQILQPEDDERRSTKETIDHTITELKRISRALGITIFVVCSVNRANYLAPIDFESLKESGSIEYTCDTILGLQLRCLSTETVFNEANKIKEKREKIKQAKAETPRKIELVCLKNRSGKPVFSTYFNYYPQFDLFTEADIKVEDFTHSEMKKGARKI